MRTLMTGILLATILSWSVPASGIEAANGFSIQPSAATAGVDLAGAPPESCATTLQAMVDAAAPGSTVRVPACVYRETVTIGKPLTLEAELGAEIRGSDVWEGWQRSGPYWARTGLPALEAADVPERCRPGSEGRCLRPEQVFLDGRPLFQVAANPTSGQFAAARGVVYLADDPTGRTVEVTTRGPWVEGRADDVTIRRFTMRHAANDAQQGALWSEGHSRWAVEGNVLSDAHGVVVSFAGGSGHRLLDNEITRAGQLGVALPGVADTLVRGNRIHGNNTEGFDYEWEAGGLKATRAVGLTLEGNEVFGNDGPGLWCDIDCRDIVVSRNQVHNNAWAGIFFEISDGATIWGNAAWENGWGKPEWGWGAGILISASRNADVHGNVVAWNADGIAVVEQHRGGEYIVSGVRVRDNFVAAARPTDTHNNFALGWISDLVRPRMFDEAAGNGGARNTYWLPEPEGRYSRFGWGREITRLAEFNATPGERDGRVLDVVAKDQTLSAAGIPLTPTPTVQ